VTRSGPGSALDPPQTRTRPPETHAAGSHHPARRAERDLPSMFLHVETGDPAFPV